MTAARQAEIALAEAAIYKAMCGEAESIYGHAPDASLRKLLRKLARKEAARATR